MRAVAALLAVLALVAAGCVTSGTGEELPAAPSGPVVLVTDEVAPKRERRPPPPAPAPSAKPEVAATPLPDGVLVVGSTGVEVVKLEERLASLTYLVGKVDGVFDRATQFGVTAFQKVEGLPLTGRGDFLTLQRLQTAEAPKAAFTTPPDHIEVDLPRQVIFVVRGGQVSASLPTSTGTNKLFRAQGWTRRAVTPNGTFTVSWKIPTWRKSPLGLLYKPSYFNGGIALHGSTSVPNYPASHGCVRIPMPFADWFYNDAAPRGMTVYVYGGPTGENPQPTIEDAPASGPEATPSPEPSPTGSGPLAPLPSLLPGLQSPNPTATASPTP
ncbi:MAG: L,D-transpeptidase family protein [Actinomycetota bacterium]